MNSRNLFFFLWSCIWYPLRTFSWFSLSRSLKVNGHQLGNFDREFHYNILVLHKPGSSLMQEWTVSVPYSPSLWNKVKLVLFFVNDTYSLEIRSAPLLSAPSQNTRLHTSILLELTAAEQKALFLLLVVLMSGPQVEDLTGYGLFLADTLSLLKNETFHIRENFVLWFWQCIRASNISSEWHMDAV